jgi:hypothetical protein
VYHEQRRLLAVCLKMKRSMRMMILMSLIE